MYRRHFLAGAATLAAGRALAQPAIGGTSKTLVFVPTTNPPSYDPVWNTAQATRTLKLEVADFGDATINREFDELVRETARRLSKLTRGG